MDPEPSQPSSTNPLPPRTPPGTREITESILLDTTGAPSLLAVTTRASGEAANTLRRELQVEGGEKFAQESLQFFQRRYTSARRVQKLAYRDDRETNEVVTAEVFEINGFLRRQPQTNLRAFNLPRSFILDALQQFTPGNVIHNYEVQASTLQTIAAPRFSHESEILQFSRRQKCRPKYWSMTLSLSISSKAVPPTQTADHEELVRQITSESAASLNLPWGVAHPRRPHEFGQLPEPTLPDRNSIEPPSQAPTATSDSRPPGARPAASDADRSTKPPRPHSSEAETAPSSRQRAREIRRMRTGTIVLVFIIGMSLLILGYVILFMLGVLQPSF